MLKRFIAIVVGIILVLSYHTGIHAATINSSDDVEAILENLNEDAANELNALLEDADSYQVNANDSRNGIVDITVYKTISETLHRNGLVAKEVEETIFVLRNVSVPGTFTFYGGIYDIAATYKTNVTWYMPDDYNFTNYLAIKFNNIKAKIIDNGTNSVYVTKMIQEVVLFGDSQSFQIIYSGSNTINSPTSGVEYTKTLNSSIYNYATVDHGNSILELRLSNGVTHTIDHGLAYAY